MLAGYGLSSLTTLKCTSFCLKITL